VGLVKNQEPYDPNKFRYQYEDYIRKPLARRAVMQTGLERIGLPGKTPFLCSLRWILSRTYRNLSQLALLRRNAFGGSPDDLIEAANQKGHYQPQASLRFVYKTGSRQPESSSRSKGFEPTS